MRNREEPFTTTADGVGSAPPWLLTRVDHQYAIRFIACTKRDLVDVPKSVRDGLPVFSASLRRVKAKLIDDLKVTLPTADGTAVAAEFVLCLTNPSPSWARANSTYGRICVDCEGGAPGDMRGRDHATACI
jgi:hypothetical protein